MRAYKLAIVLLLICTPAIAQPSPQQRPTAVQMLANQLAVSIAQNAELIERNGQLEDQIMMLRKRVIELSPKPEPTDPKPEQK